MRTTILVLGIAVLIVAVLAACRAQGDAADDSATSDNSVIPDTAEESGSAAVDTTPSSTAVPRRESPTMKTPDVRRASDSSSDATAIPEDSIRAMRPEMPQVKPGSRPRTWRGFKLPEEMPVRPPVESIRRVEQVPDSVLPADTTRPPKPDR
jgi:hypothetical protein